MTGGGGITHVEARQDVLAPALGHELRDNVAAVLLHPRAGAGDGRVIVAPVARDCRVTGPQREPTAEVDGQYEIAGPKAFGGADPARNIQAAGVKLRGRWQRVQLPAAA